MVYRTSTEGNLHRQRQSYGSGRPMDYLFQTQASCERSPSPYSWNSLQIGGNKKKPAKIPKSDSVPRLGLQVSSCVLSSTRAHIWKPQLAVPIKVWR